MYDAVIHIYSIAGGSAFCGKTVGLKNGTITNLHRNGYIEKSNDKLNLLDESDKMSRHTSYFLSEYVKSMMDKDSNQGKIVIEQKKVSRSISPRDIELENIPIVFKNAFQPTETTDLSCNATE